jgi:hypothetical protein
VVVTVSRSGSSVMSQLAATASRPIAAATRTTVFSESVNAWMYAACAVGGSRPTVVGSMPPDRSALGTRPPKSPPRFEASCVANTAPSSAVPIEPPMAMTAVPRIGKTL